MNSEKSKIIVFFDSLTSGANDIFQENWENKKDETEVVALTATGDNLVALEMENTFTSLINVVYIGDNTEITKRVDIDGGITFSTTEFINLTNNIIKGCSALEMGRNNLVNTFNIEFRNPRRAVSKIRKLNKIGLYLKI